MGVKRASELTQLQLMAEQQEEMLRLLREIAASLAAQNSILTEQRSS